MEKQGNQTWGGTLIRDSGLADESRNIGSPESQQSNLGTDCRADQDSEFVSAELLQPEGHLLLSPYSISAVQNYSQATASNLSLINKTQHSQDKFLKLRSRQAASQTVGRVPFLCPSITNRPHIANSISEVPGNYSLLSSLAGCLPAQGQIRLPAASSSRRLFPSLLRDSRLLHTRSGTLRTRRQSDQSRHIKAGHNGGSLPTFAEGPGDEFKDGLGKFHEPESTSFGAATHNGKGEAGSSDSTQKEWHPPCVPLDLGACLGEP